MTPKSPRPSTPLRWRKFSPLDRSFPILELVEEPSGVILLDVSRTDEGKFELALHEASAGRVFELQGQQEFLAQAVRALQSNDEATGGQR